MASNSDLEKLRQDQLAEQIRAYEDQKVFDVLDEIAGILKCRNPDHKSYGLRIEKCDEIECVMKRVLET
jgi:hypothetical protein